MAAPIEAIVIATWLEQNLSPDDLAAWRARLNDGATHGALLADCVGQKIAAVELADPGCVGLRLETGEVVFLAYLEQTPLDTTPRLGVDWHVFTHAEAAP